MIRCLRTTRSARSRPAAVRIASLCSPRSTKPSLSSRFSISPADARETPSISATRAASVGKPEARGRYSPIGRRDAFRPVWIGALSAAALSAMIAALLFAIGAELQGRSEAVFEGVAMLTAAGLLTWMIFWMRRPARSIRKELEAQV